MLFVFTVSLQKKPLWMPFLRHDLMLHHMFETEALLQRAHSPGSWSCQSDDFSFALGSFATYIIT